MFRIDFDFKIGINIGRPPVVDPAEAAGTTSSTGPRRSGWDDLQLWAPQKRLGRPPVMFGQNLWQNFDKKTLGPHGRPPDPTVRESAPRGSRRTPPATLVAARTAANAAPPTYHLALPQRIDNLVEIDRILQALQDLDAFAPLQSQNFSKKSV